METLLTPSVLPKLSNRFMDTLLTPADGADNRTDGPVKAKEKGASTNIAKGCWCPFGAFADMSPVEVCGQSCAFFNVLPWVQHTPGATHLGCNTSLAT